MANLMTSDITSEVARVLRDAARADGNRPYFLTAYQILDRLPSDLRARLIQERTVGGHGAGVKYGAPNVVSDAAQMLPDMEIDFIDNVGMKIEVASQTLTPGFEVCGIYRLKA